MQSRAHQRRSLRDEVYLSKVKNSSGLHAQMQLKSQVALKVRESPTRYLMTAQDLLVILPPSCEEISQNKSARHRADNANLIRRKKYNPPVPLTSISYPRHLFFGFLFLFAASTGANSYWIFIRSPSCKHQFQMA